MKRRSFLGQASCNLLGSIPVLNTLLNLRASGGLAAAASSNQEYRALVCVFLSGGNDSFNMLAPSSGPEFNEYTAARGSLALPANQLLPILPLNTPGRTFGVHHGMPRLAEFFNDGTAAFVANVGTLIEPVANRAEVAQHLKRLPLGLYSHSDQIEQWQTSVPHARSGLGWAGKMADLLAELNEANPVSMNISTDGSNVWQTGRTAAEFAAYPGNAQSPQGGAIPLAGYQAEYSTNNSFQQTMSGAIDSHLAQTYTNLLQQTYHHKRKQARDAYQSFSSAIDNPLPGSVSFPNTPLGRQLNVVTRAINGRQALGACRQTFFVNWGGWDHHSDTLQHQAAMLPHVDAAIGAFWDQITAMGLQNNIVLFSASDFGRTLSGNGRGSDHGWGGNQIVMGGPVRGQRIWGTYPSLALNPESGAETNPLDTGRGRLIPTVSCDAFFAEMALWLGVPRSSLPLVLPNIGNFMGATSTDAPVGFLM